MGNSESRRDAAVGAGFVAGGLYGAATGGIPSVGAGMVVGSIFGPLGTAIGGGIGWLVGGGAGMAVGGYIGAESVEAIMGEPKKEPERNQEKEPERKPEEEPEEESKREPQNTSKLTYKVDRVQFSGAISATNLMGLAASMYSNLKNIFTVTDSLTDESLSKEEQLVENYNNAINHGAVDIACGRVMVLGSPGVGKSTLIHSALFERRDEFAAPGHYQMAQMEGSFRIMTEEEESKTLAIMAKKVMKDNESILNDIASKVNTREAFEAENIESAEPENDLKWLEDLVCKVKNSGLEGMKDKGSDSDLTALLHVSEFSWLGFVGDILPALLTARSLFVLTFDASGCRVDDATEQHICNWITYINDGLSSKGKKLSEKLKYKNNNVTFPKVFIVGTHKDEIQGQSASSYERSIRSAIQSLHRDDAAHNYGSNIVIVDCKGDKDKDMQDIRSKIKSDICNLTISTPLTWELLRKVICAAATEKKQKFFKIEDVATAAVVCNIKAENELSSVLHFYHEHGALLFYGNVEYLKEIVITDPQWLIDQLECLDPIKYQRDQSIQQWELLRDKGILVESASNEIWISNEFTEFPNLSLGLINLMKKFHLAAEILVPEDVTTFKGQKYFIPLAMLVCNDAPQAQAASNITEREARLATLPTNEAMIQQPNQVMLSTKKLCTAKLNFIFGSKHNPPGCFIRLVVSLTMNRSFEINFHTEIHRNQISFIYKSIDEVTITGTVNHISVTVYRPKYCSLSIYETSNFRISCQTIFDAIELTLRDVVGKWFNSTEVYPAFECTCRNDSESHFARIKSSTQLSDETVRCECKSIYTFSEDQMWWLHFNISKSDRLNDKEIYQLIKSLKKPEDYYTLCNCLEIEIDKSITELDSNSFFLYLKNWLTKVGENSRGHLLYHLTRLKWKYAATLLETQKYLCSAFEDAPILNSYIPEVSRHLAQHETIARQLGITASEMDEIVTRYPTFETRREAVLRKWIDKEGTAATYKVLYDKLLEIGERGSAEDILKIATDIDIARNDHSLDTH